MWWLLLGFACSGDKDSSPNSVDDVDANVSEWTGGNFQFQTVDVEDGCLGGAFEVLLAHQRANT